MKTIVLTGGTGSLGHQLVRHYQKQINDQETALEIRIVSRDEEKQYRMRHLFEDPKWLRFYIGDVRDAESLKRPFEDADVVLHAAAMKHIDVCERFPYEAIRTNVHGAENVCRAADGVAEVVVAISTDKACEPINVYGMTKGLQERTVTGWRNGHSRFVSVRYGNVVGSRGSVVPRFAELVKEGRKLPITHPNMTRFWLRLKDAVGLIEYAIEYAAHGEIIVPRMTSSKVTELAEVMSDVGWEVVGLRPGEKIHESIISEEEATRTSAGRDDAYLHIRPFGEMVDKPIPGRLSSENAPRLDKSELRYLLTEEGWML